MPTRAGRQPWKGAVRSGNEAAAKLLNLFSGSSASAEAINRERVEIVTMANSLSKRENELTALDILSRTSVWCTRPLRPRRSRLSADLQPVVSHHLSAGGKYVRASLALLVRERRGRRRARRACRGHSPSNACTTSRSSTMTSSTATSSDATNPRCGRSTASVQRSSLATRSQRSRSSCCSSSPRASASEPLVVSPTPPRP